MLSALITSAALGEPPSGSVKLTLTTALPASTALADADRRGANVIDVCLCRDVIVDLLVDSVTVCVDHRRAEPAEGAGHVREISTGRDRDT